MSQWQTPRPFPLQPPPMYPQPLNGRQRPTSKASARRIGFGLLCLAIGLIVGIIIGYAVHTPDVQTTPISQQITTTSSQTTPISQQTTTTSSQTTPSTALTLKWTTVRTFAGNNGAKTSVFTMPDHWKIMWSCDPNSFQGIHANLKVTVYGPPDGALINVAVNIACKPGETSGSTEEHQGGQVFLVIDGGGSWKLLIQEPTDLGKGK